MNMLLSSKGFIFSLFIGIFVFSIFSSFAFAEPTFNDYTTSQINTTVYTQNLNYGFQINITNITGSTITYDIDNATWEFGKPDESYYNYTAVNISLLTTFTNTTEGIWSINFTQEQLGPAGNYNITIYANNTLDEWNSSSTYGFVINQSATNITLFLDGTGGNRSYTRGASANITVNANTSYTVVVNLSTNFASDYNTSGGLPLENITTLTYATGTYNITGFFEGDANYSADSQTYWLTISTLANGVGCSADIQCADGYCVHSICRSATTYCGDGHCDSGETCSSCSADCRACYTPPSAAPPAPTASATPGKAVVYIPSIAAASKATVTIEKAEDVDFTEITITVKNKVNYVYITIKKLDAKPTETTEVSGKVFRYISVVRDEIEDTDITEATIKFKVEKSWITNNGIDSVTVALNRFANNKWNKLNTTAESEDDDYVYYEAVTPGFSYFAISGEAVAVATTTTTTTTTTVPGTTTTTTVPTTTRPTGFPGGILGVIAVIVAIILVVLFILWSKWII